MPEKNEKQLESMESVKWVENWKNLEERICGKYEFWAWSGREKEWWMVTVVLKEMMNWHVWDQMRVLSLHDQQAGEVPWEADSRDKVMRDGRSGCWPSERWAREGYNIWRTSAALGL